MPQIIAVTGATGFIGQHLLPVLMAEGFAVRALTRRAQTTEASITWVRGDLGSKAALQQLTEGADAIIHCAGLVKARNREAFFAANADALRPLLDAVASHAPDARLIHLSSLAAREPSLSDYAASKAAAETMLGERPELFWTALRPPAVYGPGDLEILKLFKSLRYGFGFLPGSGDGRVSLIHVADLVAAILALIAAPETVRGRVYELDDGHRNGYGLGDIYKTAADLLGRPVRLVTIPATLLALAARVNLATARISGRAPMLTPGKARELTHPDWLAHEPLLNATGLWQPKIGLRQGLRETLVWYRHNLLL